MADKKLESSTGKNLDHFIAVGGMSWGKGESLREALINWIKHERPKDDAVVHFRQVNKEAYVDGMGTLYAAKESIKLPDLNVPTWLVRKLGDVEDDISDLLCKIEDAVDYSVMGGSND